MCLTPTRNVLIIRTPLVFSSSWILWTLCDYRQQMTPLWIQNLKIMKTHAHNKHKNHNTNNTNENKQNKQTTNTHRKTKRQNTLIYRDIPSYMRVPLYIGMLPYIMVPLYRGTAINRRLAKAAITKLNPSARPYQEPQP